MSSASLWAGGVLGVALLLAGVAVEEAHTQVAAGVADTGHAPPASAIVNLTASESIAAGADFVLYTVPGSRWLVVTDYRTTSSGSGVHLWMVNGSTSARRWNSDAFGQGAYPTTGFVFPPGSQVVLRNHHTGVSNTETWMHGYLTTK